MRREKELHKGAREEERNQQRKEEFGTFLFLLFMGCGHSVLSLCLLPLLCCPRCSLSSVKCGLTYDPCICSLDRLRNWGTAHPGHFNMLILVPILIPLSWKFQKVSHLHLTGWKIYLFLCFSDPFSYHKLPHSISEAESYGLTLPSAGSKGGEWSRKGDSFQKTYPGMLPRKVFG